MKSKRLKLALDRFNRANPEQKKEGSFEVLNMDEASATRGGLLSCTCDGASTTYTAPDCTCRGGASYKAASLEDPA